MDPGALNVHWSMSWELWRLEEYEKPSWVDISSSWAALEMLAMVWKVLPCLGPELWPIGCDGCWERETTFPDSILTTVHILGGYLENQEEAGLAPVLCTKPRSKVSIPRDGPKSRIKNSDKTTTKHEKKKKNVASGLSRKFAKA